MGNQVEREKLIHRGRGYGRNDNNNKIGILKIPKVVWIYKIFKYLDSADELLSLSYTCKYFRCMMYNSLVMKMFRINDFKKVDEKLLFEMNFKLMIPLQKECERNFMEMPIRECFRICKGRRSSSRGYYYGYGSSYSSSYSSYSSYYSYGMKDQILFFDEVYNKEKNITESFFFVYKKDSEEIFYCKDLEIILFRKMNERLRNGLMYKFQKIDVNQQGRLKKLKEKRLNDSDSVSRVEFILDNFSNFTLLFKSREMKMKKNIRFIKFVIA